MPGCAVSTVSSAGAPFSAQAPEGMKRVMDRPSAITSTRGDAAELVSLLASVAAGDRPALRALYERTSAKLYGICMRLLRDPSEAQDALQDVYVTVWRKAGSFDPAKASAITWLAVITRNKAIDRQRRTHASEAIDAASEVPDDAPTAFDVVEQAQDRSRLADCLGQLDERARAMIRAAFFDGITYSVLAEREQVPLPTMKSWIRRGLLRLRGCMEQ